MPGRGRSDWLADPNDYVFPTYLTALTALIARSGAEHGRLGRHVDGRSARHADGGAARARRSRGSSSTTSGPMIEPAALERIRGYFGTRPDVRDATPRSRNTSAPSRRRSAADRRAMGPPDADATSRRAADGRWGLAYDPGIAVPFRTAAAPPDLWPVWDAIRCPTLVLRGAESDLLSAATAAQMAARGPKPAVIEFAGVGHAPMLLSADQIDPVVRVPRGALTPVARGRDRASPECLPGGPAYTLPIPTIGVATAVDHDALALSACRRSIRSPANPPEIRPAKVLPWLDEMLARDPVEAARVIGDALAATNRVDDERFASGSSSPSSTGTTASDAVAAAREAILARVASADRRCAGRGQGRADARARALGRLQAPAAHERTSASCSAASGCWSR